MSDSGGVVANETAANATAIPVEGTMLAYSSLYLMAVFSICLGSFRSAIFVRKHVDDKKKIENSIGWKDARMFPLTASAVLFSLYVIFKYNDEVHAWIEYGTKFILNKGKVPEAAATPDIAANATNATVEASLFRQIINKQNFGYFLLIMLCYEGCFALAHLLKPFISKILNRLPLNKDGQIAKNLPYHLILTSKMNFPRFNSRGTKKEEGEQEELINWEWDTHDLVSLALCSLVGIAHIIKRHWVTNNIIGVSFCLYGIEALHLASFKGGAMLLAGLFVYDVFWVFATDVMSTVATSIQAPILLMFPQDLLTAGFAAKKFAMLGLGDIVIPGIFLALLLRFDKNDGKQENADKEGFKPSGRRIYFFATMGAYAAGLVLTIFVMHWFKAAQPALLYLVPCCVGCPCLIALARGEFSELYNYSEQHLVKEDESEKEKEEKKKN